MKPTIEEERLRIWEEAWKTSMKLPRNPMTSYRPTVVLIADLRKILKLKTTGGEDD